MSTSAGLAIETLLWDSTVCFQQTWVPKCRKAPGGLGQFASQGLDIPSPARSSGCRECQVPGAALCIPPLSPPCRIPGSQCSKTLMVPGCPPAGDKMSSSSIVRKPTLHRYISTKVLLAEGRETPFAEHCRNYENTYRVWDRQGGRGGQAPVPHRLLLSLSPVHADAADGDPGPEGPGTGAAPRPHQAPLPHPHGDHERDPAEVAADGCADCSPLLLGGNDAQCV